VKGQRITRVIERLFKGERSRQLKDGHETWTKERGIDPPTPRHGGKKTQEKSTVAWTRPLETALVRAEWIPNEPVHVLRSDRRLLYPLFLKSVIKLIVISYRSPGFQNPPQKTSRKSGMTQSAPVCVGRGMNTYLLSINFTCFSSATAVKSSSWAADELKHVVTHFYLLFLALAWWLAISHNSLWQLVSLCTRV